MLVIKKWALALTHFSLQQDNPSFSRHRSLTTVPRTMLSILDHRPKNWVKFSRCLTYFDPFGWKWFKQREKFGCNHLFSFFVSQDGKSQSSLEMKVADGGARPDLEIGQCSVRLGWSDYGGLCQSRKPQRVAGKNSKSLLTRHVFMEVD